MSTFFSSIYTFSSVQSPLTCIVQAVSRDILCYAMRTLSHCFIVGHVHDELIIECSPALNSMWSVNRWEDPRTGCRISFFGLMVMIHFFTRKTTDTKKMIPASNTEFSFYNQPGTASLPPLAFSFSEGITSSFSSCRSTAQRTSCRPAHIRQQPDILYWISAEASRRSRPSPPPQASWLQYRSNVCLSFPDA